MSDPGAETLSSTEQGELRHDLRTPFNGIIGYCEILLESAEDDGLEPLVPGLKDLHVGARDLLGMVNAALASEREVNEIDLRDLGECVQERLVTLQEQLQGLVVEARSGGLDTALGDLERIRQSTQVLADLVARRLLGKTEQVAPAVPVAHPVEAHSTAEAPERGPHWAARGLVLVVDDNEANRDLLCRRLEREGYAALTAVDGQEAIEMLQAGKYDLVLLDMVMPGVDGYEVLRVVKSTPQLRDIPVLMISALDEMQSVVRCIEMGAEDYLPKPFDPVLLRARVSACLEKKRMRDRELEYLRGVAILEESASAVEGGRFDAQALDAVAARPDELGRLARVFQHMASEVQARERRLKEEVAQLKIEIDMVRLSKQVEEVTAAPVFDSLVGARERLRQKKRPEGGT